MQIIGALLVNVGAKAAVATYMEERAARGLRALGVATSADEGASWQLLGLISLLDPPREDTAETIKQANALGVEVRPCDKHFDRNHTRKEVVLLPSMLKL